MKLSLLAEASAGRGIRFSPDMIRAAKRIYDEVNNIWNQAARKRFQPKRLDFYIDSNYGDKEIEVHIKPSNGSEVYGDMNSGPYEIPGANTSSSIETDKYYVINLFIPYKYDLNDFDLRVLINHELAHCFDPGLDRTKSYSPGKSDASFRRYANRPAEITAELSAQAHHWVDWVREVGITDPQEIIKNLGGPDKMHTFSDHMRVYAQNPRLWRRFRAMVARILADERDSVVV